MAVKKLGEDGAKSNAGNAAILVVGSFMENVKGFEFVDDPDHRAMLFGLSIDRVFEFA